MPNYPITGMRSHRHPFVGFGNEEEVPSTTETKTEEVDKTFVKKSEPIDIMKYASPMISGVLMSVVTYGVARAASVEKKKSTNVAIVMGGFTALGQALSGWLWEKLQGLKG